MRDFYNFKAKGILLIFLFLAFFNFLALSQTTNPPIAHWNLDEGTGTDVADVTGNGHNGILIDSLTKVATTAWDTLWVDGIFNKALEINHRTCLSVPTFEIENSTDGAFSASMWINTTQTSILETDDVANWWKGQFIIDHDKGDSPGFAFTNHYHKIKLNVAGVVIISTDSIDDGLWHHIVVGRKPDGQTFIYIDGGLSVNSGDNLSTVDMIHTQPYTIGGANSDGRFEDGKMDDIRFFDYALDETEIAALHLVNVNRFERDNKALSQNYPNPVSNGETMISYTLYQPSGISLDIFDMSGKKVKNLANGYYKADSYTVSWDCTNENGDKLPGGVYFYSLKFENGKTISRKLVLVQ